MHIFRHIFLSNYWWQRSDIWSQASYRYPISWEAFLDPSDSYFLFVDLVGFYTHWTYMYMHIFRHIFLSNYWWQKSDIWSLGHKLHIGTPYRGKRFWTHRIPTSCLPTLLIFIHIEHICTFFVTFFSATIDGRDLIFGHKLHIGTPYRGKRFWTRQIPTSCLPTVDFSTHWTYMLIFRRIFLSNYWWQKSDIWSQASYRYPISWEVFFDPSDSYFLFAKERGYHRWALAHSSSCSICHCYLWYCKINKINKCNLLTLNIVSFFIINNTLWSRIWTFYR